MNQLHGDTETGVAVENRTLEAALKHLWEKARAAAGAIAELREENTRLRARLGELEDETLRLKSDSIRKEQEIKRLQAEHSQLADSLTGTSTFTNEEKEALKSKIKELISKINSHL